MEKKLDLTKYYTITKAAKVMGVDRVTVYRWIKKGKLKTVTIAGKNWIPKESLFESEE